MIIDSPKDLFALQKIGAIVSETLKIMKTRTVPGISTQELDRLGLEYLKSKGARSAPMLCYDFPGATCISVNEEAAHGIPGPRIIKAGDLVNIDVSAELDGYFADTGASFVVPPVRAELQNLCTATYGALKACLKIARAGTPLNRIGKTIEDFAQLHNYTIIKNLCSHGVGRALHEYPTEILPFYNARDKRTLVDGMVITIEPFLSNGAWLVDESQDGWTLKTPKSHLCAQFEHTLVITHDEPILLTHHDEI